MMMVMIIAVMIRTVTTAMIKMVLADNSGINNYDNDDVYDDDDNDNNDTDNDCDDFCCSSYVPYGMLGKNIE